MHQTLLSADEQWIANVHSRANRPPELFIMRNQPGAEMAQLTTSPTADWLAGPWIVPEIVWITASDGVKVPARIYRPRDMNAQPNGAGVIFVHGAGYLQNAHKYWSTYFREYMFHNLLAQRGYVVLDVDYRASSGYGRDWRTAIYRQMGHPEVEDLQDGVAWLAAKQLRGSGRWETSPARYQMSITAMAGLALLARRAVMGKDSLTVPFLLIVAFISAVYVGRMTITPDQIWAIRRYLPVTIPGFVLLAFWGIDRWFGWTAKLRRPEVPRGLGYVAAVLAVVVPFSVLAPVAGVRNHVGMLRVTEALCDRLPADAAVLIPKGQAELLELGQRLLVDLRRRHVIVEAAVLVVRDDEQALAPLGALRERLVDGRQKGLPIAHVGRRMVIVANAQGGERRIDERKVRQRAARGHRRDEPDPVRPVVDAAPPPRDRHEGGGESREQRQREVAVRDRLAARQLAARALDVDVDPLVIAGRVGELPDAVLGHREPVADGDFLAETGSKRQEIRYGYHHMGLGACWTAGWE